MSLAELVSTMGYAGDAFGQHACPDPEAENSSLLWLVLVFDAQPAVALVVAVEGLRRHRVREREEGRLPAPLLPEGQVHLCPEVDPS